ncbi:MAG TPA: hypothetical protein VH575_06490 [Gemmataceae bacterium]|jgi:hypothetical protein
MPEQPVPRWDDPAMWWPEGSAALKPCGFIKRVLPSPDVVVSALDESATDKPDEPKGEEKPKP